MLGQNLLEALLQPVHFMYESRDVAFERDLLKVTLKSALVSDGKRNQSSGNIFLLDGDKMNCRCTCTRERNSGKARRIAKFAVGRKTSSDAA